MLRSAGRWLVRPAVVAWCGPHQPAALGGLSPGSRWVAGRCCRAAAAR